MPAPLRGRVWGIRGHYIPILILIMCKILYPLETSKGYSKLWDVPFLIPPNEYPINLEKVKGNEGRYFSHLVYCFLSLTPNSFILIPTWVWTPLNSAKPCPYLTNLNHHHTHHRNPTVGHLPPHMFPILIGPAPLPLKPNSKPSPLVTPQTTLTLSLLISTTLRDERERESEKITKKERQRQF